MPHKYRLVHFNTRLEFDNQVQNWEEINDNEFWNCLVFIKDTKEIYTHGQFYDCAKYNDEELNQLVSDLSKKTDELESDKADAIHTHSYEDLLSNNDPNKILVSTESSFILKDIEELTGVSNTSKQLRF